MAAVCFDDMYAGGGFSLATEGYRRPARPWVTDRHEHDGLWVSNGTVLPRFIDMVRGG